MRLEPSHKKIIIIIGTLLVIYAGQKIYRSIDDRQEAQRVQDQFDRVYAANPSLKAEIEASKELARIYGPQALEPGFSPDTDLEGRKLREIIKLPDGGEKITKFYSENNPREEYFVKNGMREGVFKSWDSSGRLVEESMYKNDLLDGIQKTFYTNGNTKTEITYVDGKRSGPMKNWYQNGKQSAEIEYKDNNIVGSTAFYPDGSIRMKESLNEKTGLTLTEAFYANGKLSHSYNSKNGRKEGLLLKNAPSGAKAAEAEYKDGASDGWCRIWNDLGKLSTEVFYEQGRINHSKSIAGTSCNVDIWRFGFR